MAELTGNSWLVFFGLTVLVMGFAAVMTGRALAENWRPIWQCVAYTLLLGGVDRFLSFALFEASLLSLVGYCFDTAVLLAASLASYRLTRANRMVKQYPWLYERTGPFTWRDRTATSVSSE